MRLTILITTGIYVLASSALGIKFTRAQDFEAFFSNKAAFNKTIQYIEGAEKRLDLAFFIYSDDYSSSYLSQKLLDRAKQGTKIRLLLDWLMAKNLRPVLKTLMAESKGNLQIAYYRPLPKEVLEDLSNLGVENPMLFLKGISAMDPDLVFEQLQGWKQNPLKEFSEVLLLGDLLEKIKARYIENATDDKITARIKKTKLHPKAWLDASKRLHHKLLIADDDKVLGGGRNIEDSYHWEIDHPLRVRQGKEAKYVFIDQTFALTSKEIARKARDTFDKYWDCGENPNMCPNRQLVVMESTKDLANDDIKKNMETLRTRSNDFARHLKQASTLALQRPKLSARNIDLSYLEVTLFPKKKRNEIVDTKSEFHEELIELMDEVKAGEEILLHNAYVFIPSGVWWALRQAILRGVRVTIQTNSEVSSDLGFISKIARPQFRELLKLGKKHKVWDTKTRRKINPVSIYEYHTSESLHAKAFVIGPEILIFSSVNLDPRCKLLDTGNGVFVKDAKLVKNYMDGFIKQRNELLKKERKTREGKIAFALKQVTLQTLMKSYKDMIGEWKALVAQKKLTRRRFRLRKTTVRLLHYAVHKSLEDSEKGMQARKFLEALFIQL